MWILQSATQDIFFPNRGMGAAAVVIPDAGNLGTNYKLLAPSGGITTGGGTVTTGTLGVALTKVAVPLTEMLEMGTHTVILLDAGAALVGTAQYTNIVGQPSIGAGQGRFVDKTGTETNCTTTAIAEFVKMTIPNTACGTLGPFNAYMLDTVGNPMWHIGGTVVPTFAPGGLDAAGVRAAVGLATANLDTQLSAATRRAAIGLASANLDTQLGNILAAISSSAQPGDAMTLTAGERAAVSNALLDLADAIETGLTPRQALRLVSSSHGGIIQQTAPGVWQFKGAGVGTARIIASIPGDGSRPAMTLNL